MSRETTATDHRGLQVLTAEECDDLLDATPVGRVAFINAGRPVILPVTYAYRNRSIVFRTGIGAKLDAAARCETMGFEIDGWDTANQTGWSVVVSGWADLISDDDETAELERIGLPAWARADRVRGWVRITPTQITGRRLV